jgi:hypothetical protein
MAVDNVEEVLGKNIRLVDAKITRLVCDRNCWLVIKPQIPSSALPMTTTPVWYKPVPDPNTGEKSESGNLEWSSMN